MVHKENKVQTAIASALQVYCDGNNLRLFAPYANQQGEKLRAYCADLLGVLDGADLIALEVKELDIASGELKSFEVEQHRAAIRFERLGVPLGYAYNAIDVDQLPYEMYPQPQNWASDTLAAIKRSNPTPLPGPVPDIEEHKTLLDWITGAHGTQGLDLFGRTHGAIAKVDELRNGMLVLLYSVSKTTLAALKADEIQSVVKVLRSSSQLTQDQIGKLSLILDGEADVFSKFAKPPPVSTTPPPRAGDRKSSKKKMG